MTGHPEQWSGQRQRDASELREHLLSAPGGDTMANSTTTSTTTSTNGSSAAQQRLEEKRREAEAQGSGAAPASERWAIQVRLTDRGTPTGHAGKTEIQAAELQTPVSTGR